MHPAMLRPPDTFVKDGKRPAKLVSLLLRMDKPRGIVVNAGNWGTGKPVRVTCTIGQDLNIEMWSD